MNILFTSAGRRVQLIRIFKKTRGIGGVVAGDIGNTAPAQYAADIGIVLPKETSPEFIPFIQEVSKKYQIDVIIPLSDFELGVLSKYKNELAQNGVSVLISDPSVIDICQDKLQTYKFFKASGIPTPLTFNSPYELTQNISFPLLIKPRRGSAGRGVNICNSLDDVEYHYKSNNDMIIQQLLRGDEVTLDVLCSMDGECLSVIPRKRLKIRGGEVERAITIDAPELLDWVVRIIKQLKPIGPLNIQCFVTEEGAFFTEINPRFGGGYPLSYYAGADFPQMVFDMLNGKAVEPCLGGYERDLLMLRFDDSFFLKGDNLINGFERGHI